MTIYKTSLTAYLCFLHLVKQLDIASLFVSLFSQGGFARVYEVTDMSTNKVYALKAVPKAKLTKSADRYNKVSN